jgi:hypothetical protein
VQHFGGKINDLADGAKILAQSNFDPDSASLRHRNAEDGEKLAQETGATRFGWSFETRHYAPEHWSNHWHERRPNRWR